MAQRSGLGKGLESLIPTWQNSPTPTDSAEQVRLLPIESISPNPQQPRKVFEEEHLEDLAASIKQHGIIQPLIVITAESADRYTLIAGERRLRAARLAGLKEVPAIVRTASQQEQLEFAIIENVQREDLNPMERAKAYQSLADQFSLTHEEIAHRMGKSRVTITNTLRLLNLPLLVQQALYSGEISEGHARSLLALPNARAIEAALDSILSLGLNVRQTELLVSKLSGKAQASQNRPPDPRKPMTSKTAYASFSTPRSCSQKANAAAQSQSVIILTRSLMPSSTGSGSPTNKNAV